MNDVCFSYIKVDSRSVSFFSCVWPLSKKWPIGESYLNFERTRNICTLEYFFHR